MRYAFLCLLVCHVSSAALANDWLTLPGPYTHDPQSGQRVSQYAPIAPPTATTAPNFRTSGFTNTRSSLNYGGSADNYHRVEKWGEEVRPYGEWRFPYRPYSVPYSQWGPPFAGFNSGFGGFGYGPGLRGSGYGPGRGPGFQGPGYGPGYGPGFQGPGYGPGFQGPGYGPNGIPRGGDPGDRGEGRPNLPPDPDRGWWPRRPPAVPQASPFNPYPAGPGSPYPVAPYYDGYYPEYRR